jgi:four helix bundle protein
LAASRRAFLAVYKLTTCFPPSERFGLSNQLRRASVSVTSNIAEGSGRAAKGEYVQFLGSARGSNCEVLTQIVIARGLHFGSEEALQITEDMANQVGRMLVVMMRKLRS